MAIDPQMRAVIERANNSGLPPYYQVSAAEARRLYKETRGALSPAVPEIGEVRDLAAPGLVTGPI